MKKRTFKVGLSLLFTVVLGISGCGNTHTESNNQQGIIVEDFMESDNMTEQNSVAIDDLDIDYVDSSYTTSENLYAISDVVKMNGISYQIHSFEKTKKFGDRNKDTLVDYLGDRIDADNNLVSDESYVFITMTITNETEEEVEVYRCPGYVVSIDENMEVLQVGECVYMDEYWHGGDASSIYAYSLKPGESVTSEFADIVCDAYLEGKGMYYDIPYSDDLGDPNNIFIKLED